MHDPEAKEGGPMIRTRTNDRSVRNSISVIVIIRCGAPPGAPAVV
jgi:hypothetical protein